VILISAVFLSGIFFIGHMSERPAFHREYNHIRHPTSMPVELGKVRREGLLKEGA